MNSKSTVTIFTITMVFIVIIFGEFIWGIWLVGGRSTHTMPPATTATTQAQPPPTQATKTPTQGEQTFVIPLLGEDELSEPFDLNALPSGSNVSWEGPSKARVHFSDGSNGYLTKCFGVKGGVVRFSGPAGESVTIHVWPPNQDQNGAWCDSGP